jgi:hypothetical protein
MASPPELRVFGADERAKRLLSTVKHYTNFVKASRRFLWIVLVGLLMVVIAFPLMNKDRAGVRLAFSTDNSVPDEQPIMRNPRFQGVDESQQPFMVTAEYAVQKSVEEIILHKLQADMSSNDGTWMIVQAGSGQLFLEQRKMVLQDKVHFYHDKGYEFETEGMKIDMAAGTAVSDAPVIGQTMAGYIKAGNFSMNDRGQTLQFGGKVEMKIYPNRIDK